MSSDRCPAGDEASLSSFILRGGGQSGKVALFGTHFSYRDSAGCFTVVSRGDQKESLVLLHFSV